MAKAFSGFLLPLSYFIFAVFNLLCADSCARPDPRPEPVPSVVRRQENIKLREALRRADIPQAMAEAILDVDEADFMPTLLVALEGDPYFRLLVDKGHPVEPLKYRPYDLVELTNEGAFRVPRTGMLLRYPAAVALETMAQAALKDGVRLTVSSTWRSYDYQVEVYNRNVRQNGQAAADRESARPGYSQHQLGLVIDFGSITDEFAETTAGKWLVLHGGEYGWSLSFPDGYEALTGYRWESWHYRFVGKMLAQFIDRWFGGIQQYAFQFIYEWENYQIDN